MTYRIKVAPALVKNADEVYELFRDGDCTVLPQAIIQPNSGKQYMVMRVDHFLEAIEHFEKRRCKVRARSLKDKNHAERFQ